MSDDQILIFFDIETTGTDRKKDHILEVYAAVYDQDLAVPIDDFEAVIRPAVSDNQWLYDLPHIVRQMHSENKLLDDVLSRGRSPLVVFAELEAFFNKYPKALLVGRNVGTFDRAFIEAAYPGVSAALHYRCLDLSSILTLFKIWPSECGPVLPQARSNHRAGEDVGGDLDTLRAIVDWYCEL